MNLEVNTRETGLKHLLTRGRIATITTFPRGLLALLRCLLRVRINRRLTVALLINLLSNDRRTRLNNRNNRTLLNNFFDRTIVRVYPLMILALHHHNRVLDNNTSTLRHLGPRLNILLLIINDLLRSNNGLLVTFLLNSEHGVNMLITNLTLTNGDLNRVTLHFTALRFRGCGLLGVVCLCCVPGGAGGGRGLWVLVLAFVVRRTIAMTFGVQINSLLPGLLTSTFIFLNFHRTTETVTSFNFRTLFSFYGRFLVFV